LLACFPAYAQDWSVWQNNEKVALHAQENTWVILVADSLYGEMSGVLSAYNVTEEQRYRKRDKQIIWIQDHPLNQRDDFKSQTEVPVYISPVFELENGNMMHTTGELLVRWKRGITQKQKNALESQ